jgi:hypothetical protein
MPTGMMMRRSRGRLLVKAVYQQHAILGRLETAINGRPRGVLSVAVADLEDLNKTLEDIAAKSQYGVAALGSIDHRHLRIDWFGPNGMWPYLYPATEAIVRAGLIRLLKRLLTFAAQRPTVRAHWVPVPNFQFVDVRIEEGSGTMDLFIVTPPPK